jgi:hypothetical protein
MTKSKLAERELIKLGYQIEGRISPRGNKLIVAVKEGKKNIYETTLIKLYQTVKDIEEKSNSKL